MQCPRWDSIPGPFALKVNTLPNKLKEIFTNSVRCGGTVHINVGRGVYLLRPLTRGVMP